MASYLGPQLGEKPEWEMQLDYIILSKTGLRVVEKNGAQQSGVYRPTSGFSTKPLRASDHPGNPVWPDTPTFKDCAKFLSRDFLQLRTASDHIPLWAKIEVF